MPYESLLERDALIVLDVDPAVVDFSAQPKTFVWTEGRRKRQYTPDLMVVLDDGQIVYRQVKPAAFFARNPTLDRRLLAIEKQCTHCGASHEIWLDTDIRRQPRLANARRIRASASFIAEEGRAAVYTALGTLRMPTTLGIAMDRLGGKPEQLNLILGIVARGALAIDLDATLSRDAALWLGSEYK
ncbi:TnsA endonuclease N-terminal domain-containing protein [Hoeflea sp.]|uniref:TnsA endonuclease N-terminal domain-containing protein n=1 Tax=Hoeflea sp. TaxID=1940281 RepID=UPI003B0245DD